MAIQSAVNVVISRIVARLTTYFNQINQDTGVEPQLLSLSSESLPSGHFSTNKKKERQRW